jgi:translation initiation factor IF-3
VRVIDEKGKQVGVLKITDALKKAQYVGLDLVEIAAKAKPPVVKIISLGKFKYQQEKRDRAQKKKAKQTDIKEVRFSPFIGSADYHTRYGRVKEFLSEGHKIRAVVKFKGRQMGSKSFGYNLLKKLLTELGNQVNVDMEPKFLGRHLSMVISPMKMVKRAGEPDSTSKKNKDNSKNTKKSKSNKSVKGRREKKVSSSNKIAKNKK